MNSIDDILILFARAICLLILAPVSIILAAIDVIHDMTSITSSGCVNSRRLLEYVLPGK